MDSVQTNSHKQDNYILKSNLWKFFKTTSTGKPDLLSARGEPYCVCLGYHHR